MQARNVMHRCRAVVPITDCSATAHRRGILFLASVTARKVIVLSIADISAILRTISLVRSQFLSRQMLRSAVFLKNICLYQSKYVPLHQQLKANKELCGSTQTSEEC